MLVAVFRKYMYNIDVIYVLQSIEEKFKPDILNTSNIYHVMQIHACICLDTEKYEDTEFREMLVADLCKFNVERVVANLFTQIFVKRIVVNSFM